MNGKWSDGTTSGDIVYTGGNVGIGTDEPQSALTIEGSTGLRIRGDHDGAGNVFRLVPEKGETKDRILTFENSSSGNTAGWLFESTVLDNDVMMIQNQGRVGIGTTSPGSALEVASTNSSQLTLRNTDTTNGTAGYGNLWADNNGLWLQGHGDTSGQSIILNPNGGNVGIGTTDPGAKLEVAGLVQANAGSELGWNSFGLDYFYDSNIGKTRHYWNRIGRVGKDGASNSITFEIILKHDVNYPHHGRFLLIASGFSGHSYSVALSGNNAFDYLLEAGIDEEGYVWVRPFATWTHHSSWRVLYNRNGAEVLKDGVYQEEDPAGFVQVRAGEAKRATHDGSNITGVTHQYSGIYGSHGTVGIGTSDPAARLHVESSNREDSINRVCPAGTLWASFFDGNADHDWNGDSILDGRDYGALDGIDTNDYLEDNECVVFGTSTGNAAGATPASGEFWIDTDLDREVDAGEIITGATTTLNGDAVVAASPNKCEDGYVWLNQRVDAGDEPVAGECIAPQLDENSDISRVDFTGESCPTGTQKRDENEDGNTDDGECHIPALFVQSDGDVGIGTSSPAARLEIANDATYMRMKSKDDSIASIGFTSSSDTVVSGIGHDFVSGKLFLSQGGSAFSNAAFVLQSNGNVGIGTTSPGAKLEINAQDSSEQVILRRTKVSTQDEGHYSFGADGGGLKFWSGGYANSGGSAEVLFDPNGNITANSVFYESDSRYKKDIQTLPSALKNILSLRGVSYYWKDRNDNTQQIGVIAQEVEKIYPQLVHTNEDGYKSVAYSNLVSPLIEAVKELHALYQGHADRIALLEMQNAELRERDAALEEQNVGLLKTVVQLEVRLAALEAAQ